MAQLMMLVVMATYRGAQYRVERRPDANGRGTVQDRFPGIGVIGSERRWIGDRRAARATWYAAVNPSGQPGRATARVEGLPSRRAALDSLFSAALAEAGS